MSRVLAPGRNIVLIGMMGAGKSTVGRLLAQQLERPFVDTDEVIEAELGMPIARIFAELGERGFRDAESEVIRHVAALRGRVVAVGGGAVQRPANVTHLRATGDIILLEADPATLARRVGGDPGKTRPLLATGDTPEQQLARLRAVRDDDYRRAAVHTVVTTGVVAQDVAQEVLRWAATRSGLLAQDEVPL